MDNQSNYAATSYHLTARTCMCINERVGIISNKTLPGGGTTDYAVDIFYSAIRSGAYTCFLREDSVLPMMYMPDAVKAAVDLLVAPQTCLSQSTYNVSAFSFTPAELAVRRRFCVTAKMLSFTYMVTLTRSHLSLASQASIQQRLPEFKCDYEVDFRQNIADSWPRILDDRNARKDWVCWHVVELLTIVKIL